MTTIQSSSLPLYSSVIGSTSPLSGDWLSNQIDLQQPNNNSDNTFGDAYSLNISDAAISMFGSGSGSSDDSSSDILNMLTYSNFSGLSGSTQDSGDSIGALLSNLGGGTGSSAPVVPTSTSGASFSEAVAADGGPLPAFLAYVDSAMGLNSTQQQSLQNIANENMNIQGDTPAAVAQIAAELQQAGIPETI